MPEKRPSRVPARLCQARGGRPDKDASRGYFGAKEPQSEYSWSNTAGQREDKNRPSLPGLVGHRYSSVASASLLGGLPDALTKISGMLLAVSNQLAETNPFSTPDWSRLVLTADEEAEFAAHAFRSRISIEIPGVRLRRNSNAVLMNGHQAVVTDANFVLLLRLIASLYETPDGYCVKGDNSKKGGLFEELELELSGINQAIHRLRKDLQPGLDAVCLPQLQLIEVYRGCVRLSTHRRYVQLNHETLSKHPNKTVRQLLGRIPSSAPERS